MSSDTDPRSFARRVFTGRGLPLSYVREGVGGLPLLLVHGWPETARIWWRNIGPLAQAGFEVIAPDLRGFGDSGLAPDGFYDTVAHSRDLHALVREELGHDRVIAAGGDLGGVLVQDVSMRWPGWVQRLILFNSPLPYSREKMAGMRTRSPMESRDYYVRQGTDADALAAELTTAAQRRRYIATFYTSRFWAHPGHFDDAAIDFMTEPFADGAKLRASFANYESAYDPAKRTEPAAWGENPTETLILFGPSDHVIYPDFDRMAAVVFPRRVGPFLLRDAGHFLQWERAEVFNGAVASFCRDLLGRS